MDPKAFFNLSYGMYIVCSKKGELVNGQLANTVFQISSEPLTLAISINKKNYTHEFITESKVFSVSVLPIDTPPDFIGGFGFRSGRDANKFAEVKHRLGATGVPVELENTLAYFEAEVIDSVDVATHTVFVGKVSAAEVVAKGVPMTYANYHEIKSGKTPGNMVKTETAAIEQPASSGIGKYRCVVCGYIYDPAEGDPDSGIEPGTPFEQIPDDWECPICAVGKDQFEKVV